MIINTKETQSCKFDKLEMIDGNSFFVLHGNVERIRIETDKNKNGKNIGLKKSISEYLKLIETKPIFDRQTLFVTGKSRIKADF